MNQKEKIAWLQLFRTENIGPITFYKLLERFGTAQNAIKALPNIASKGGRLSKIKLCDIAIVEKELEQIEKMGAKLIVRDEKTYPKLLAELEDAPPVITVLGNVDILSKKSLAVVGARNSSTVGRRIAEEYSRDISNAGFIITSGLARGIDTAAHKASLECGTVAVVAGGIDVIYPKENKELFEEIIKNGAVVAESPFGTEPIARHFPKRNRIISGLSMAVLVVEAALKSGSLITARMALEQNREIFAVPGSPFDPRATGTNKLIRDGANIANSAKDIIMDLKTLHHRPMCDSAPNKLEGCLSLSDMEEIKAPKENLYDDILNELTYTPVNIDDIIRAVDSSTADVLTVILELELSGFIERQLGNKVNLI